jgi:hypothetical protein
VGDDRTEPARDRNNPNTNANANFGGILQRFDSKDGSGTSPNLIVLGPNAVTLSRLEASSGARALPSADNVLWTIGAAIALGILLGQCLWWKKAT